MSGVTIAITDELVPQSRRITKIVPYKSGGFAIMVPYHNERRGYLAKHAVNYNKREDLVYRSDCVEYSAKNRVKLSIHPDGFVQFSAENPGTILSGRDPVTGMPKGLGIMSNPLSHPVTTGPTFGLTIWGLDAFEPLKLGSQRSVITFSEENFYYRSCTPDDWNGYFIEGFVFSHYMWAGVRKRGGELTLTLFFHMFDAGGAALDFRVIPLPDQQVFLGLLVSRAKIEFESQSGFALSGPSDRDNNALMAMYPVMFTDLPSKSLDYLKESHAQ